MDDLEIYDQLFKIDHKVHKDLIQENINKDAIINLMSIYIFKTNTSVFCSKEHVKEFFEKARLICNLKYNS